MKAKYYVLIFMAILAGVLSSCRDEGPDVLNSNGRTEFEDWSDVFESYWYAMNYSYAFWSVDPTDWDDVYNRYKPKFEGLKFNNSADSVKVNELFEELTSTLVDHHYAFYLKTREGDFYSMTRPAQKDVESRDYYHEKLDQELMFNNLLALKDRGRVSSGVAFMNEAADFIIYSALIDNSVAYIRLSAFKICEYLDDEKMTGVLDNFYAIINGTPGLKGIIIDTRSNGGGIIDDIHILLAPMLTDDLPFLDTRSKVGMGRLDYTPWVRNTIHPLSAGDNIVERDLSDVSIVSLVDIRSVSMGEITGIAISELPNGTVIGERTWGGHGPLAGDPNVYYAGKVENDAFMIYTSTSMTRRLDGKCYEGIGLTPDIEALYDDAAFQAGTDTQLERALTFIRTGK